MRQPQRPQTANKEFLDAALKLVTVTDGYHYIVKGEDFIRIMADDGKYNRSSIHAYENAQISNISLFKRRLITMVTERMKAHEDMYVVLKKKPNPQGELIGFVFDAFLFNNITMMKVGELRGKWHEEKRGLFTTYKHAALLRKRKLVPYYAKMLPGVTETEDPTKGVFILRKFY